MISDILCRVVRGFCFSVTAGRDCEVMSPLCRDVWLSALLQLWREPIVVLMELLRTGGWMWCFIGLGGNDDRRLASMCIDDWWSGSGGSMDERRKAYMREDSRRLESKDSWEDRRWLVTKLELFELSLLTLRSLLLTTGIRNGRISRVWHKRTVAVTKNVWKK